ncbi:hypothetical protein [Stenotrophomonas sp. SXG-1]|uniref:hypothetical protein n=1 Tax=Stenotrophomonas sp. SXG-1 TaxID=2682487 RepID=UPI00177DBE79|nr:hypothetical protein [Stenotrophomonas sp. SXG-1]
MSHLLSTDALIDLVAENNGLKMAIAGLAIHQVQISVVSIAHYRATINAPGVPPSVRGIHAANLDAFVHKAEAQQLLRDVNLRVAEGYAHLRGMELKDGAKRMLSSENLFVLATAWKLSLTLITPNYAWLSQLSPLGLKLLVYKK